jgi:hypothetical protein
MDRITAIRRSLAAFVCGITSFFPLIGFIPAVCALGHWLAVKRKYRDPWNPAGSYLTAGLVLALFGLLNSIVLALVLALAIANSLF